MNMKENIKYRQFVSMHSHLRLENNRVDMKSIGGLWKKYNAGEYKLPDQQKQPEPVEEVEVVEDVEAEEKEKTKPEVVKKPRKKRKTKKKQESKPEVDKVFKKKNQEEEKEIKSVFSKKELKKLEDLKKSKEMMEGVVDMQEYRTVIAFDMKILKGKDNKITNIYQQLLNDKNVHILKFSSEPKEDEEESGCKPVEKKEETYY